MGNAKKTKAELLEELEAAQSRIRELENGRGKPGEFTSDNEAHYQEMFENAQVGLYRTRIDGSGPITVNKKLADILGFTVEELMSRPTVISWADPGKRDELVAILEGKGHVTDYEIEMLNKSGEIITCLAFVKSYPVEGYLEGTLVDITEIKRTEDALRFRMEFEEVISQVSANFISLPFERTDEAIDNSLELMGRFREVDRSCLFLFSDDASTLSNSNEWCNEDIEPQINDMQEVPLDLFTDRLDEFERTGILFTPSLQDLPPGAEVEKDLSEIHGTKSYLLVSIQSEGKMIGFVSFNMVRKERIWGEDDIALLKIVANIFASVIERQKKIKALKENEQRLRNVLDTITDWVWEVDENGVYSYSGPGVKSVLGYAPEDIIGMSPFDLMPEEEANRLADLIGPLFAAREPIKLVGNVFLHAEGHSVVLETNAVPFFSPGGEFRGYRGSDREVSEID